MTTNAGVPVLPQESALEVLAFLVTAPGGSPVR
jgi:hypothetical protein